MQTESKNFKAGGTSDIPIPAPPLPMTIGGELVRNFVAAHVANTGETVNIPDVYVAEGFDFSGTRKFDASNDYRSKSMLVAPMRNHEGDIIGVLQLLNAQDADSGESIPFSSEYENLIMSLASQAAVAVTKTKLLADLEELFESLIRLVASAIDEKSPYTAGHITRVAGLSQEIGKAVNAQKEGPFADVNFDYDEMNELRIAAWLHDIGKITTPEAVVDKRTKLEKIFDRIELVSARFEMIRRGMRIMADEQKIERLLAGGSFEDLTHIDEDLAEKIAQLDDDLKFIAQCNTPGEFLKDDAIERLEAIAKLTYTRDGKELPYITADELQNLSIRKGSLTDAERQIINNHVVATIKMLSQIPFPKRLARVVEFAGAHHEKLNGTGYPNGWNASRLALQSRILCLADICEALTAKDRPYKEPMSTEQAFKILGFMVKDEEIDPDLLEMFEDKQVYQHYMEKYDAEEAERKALQEAVATSTA